ncbi:hypothetical protein [Methanococcoides sp. NM1]|uniref:carboxylate--amine ligase n=1 Tax=Methanococcoides sp. NM1 TaxID=1201013 RepID=UPI0010828B84|nr:hypothetical protein [Methanococcoides sp. NM1]
MDKNENHTIPGIVLIGDHVQALGVARSIGQLNVPVYLLNDKRLSVVRFSKYISKFIRAPSLKDKSEFVSFLLEIAELHGLKDHLLIPANDDAVKILSKNKTKLEEWYIVPTPEWEITKFALDKKLTHILASNNGVPVPATVSPSSISEKESLSQLNIQYPVLVKGVEGLGFYQKTGAKAFHASSEKELKSILKKISHIEPSEILIQEMIPGGTDSVYSFCSFFKNGKAIGIWTGHKIREHPMGSGTATLAESKNVPEIVDLGSKILKAMNYYGVSEIEFKKDSRDGKFKLIEINARSWLWVSLARRSGMDFIAMLYNDMNGKEPEITISFEEHIKWINIYTDTWSSFKEILKGNLSTRNYLSSLAGKKEYAVLSRDDPLPFLVETLILPYLLMTR